MRELGRRARHPREWARRAALVGLALALAITVVAIEPPQSASAAPAPSVTMAAFYGGGQSTGRELPVGAGWEYLVNYSCATEACSGYSIEVSMPAGVVVGSPNYGSDITGVQRTGTTETGVTLRFTLASPLPPGTSGQLSIPASTPGFSTADGSSFSAVATMASTDSSAPSSTSQTITMVTRADIQLRTTAELASGGVIDDESRYRVWTCLDQVLPQEVWGFLGTEAGSVLEVDVPEGAVVVSAVGSTFVAGTAGAPDRLVYTYGARTNLGCTLAPVTLRYPAGDPSNVDGAEKELVARWTAAELGKSSATYVGSVSHDLRLPPPASGTLVRATLGTPRDYGSSPTKKAAIGDDATVYTSVVNSGPATWTTGTLEVPVPSLLRTTTVTATNPGGDATTVQLRTTCGPDRALGTGDDGTWQDALSLPGLGGGSFDPRAQWPNGAAALPSDCHVISVRMGLGAVPPVGEVLTLVVTGRVMATGRDGVATREGDDFSSSPELSATTGGGTTSQSVSVTGEVDQPKSTVTLRNFGPGTLAPGVTEGDARFGISNRDNPLPDPVITVLLPRNVSLASWSGSGSGLPTPTATEIADFAGTGRTLVRWTFPEGTVMPTAVDAYVLDYRMALDEFAYGSLRAAGRVDSSSTSVICGDDYFGAGTDGPDYDGDGDLTEQTCRWDADIAPNPSASAAVVTKVKGSFDPTFVAGPATGQSSPGADDTYRIEVKNNGRIELTDVVLVDRLPRPGDTNTLTSAPRNPSTGTFPVVLRGRPTLPALAQPTTLYYSTVVDACLPELDHAPTGCNAPQWTEWDSAPPTSLAAVTMVRVDLGANVLTPGNATSIDLPVTTPTSGSTEPEYASLNPNPLTTANEVATNTAAFRARRGDNSSQLNAAEPPGVSLEMPGVAGPVADPPTPSPVVTSGIGPAEHTATVEPPTLGRVALLDGDGDEVDELVVDGIGTYTVDPDTGSLRFTPELGYVGTAPAVGYRVTDAYGQSGDSTWTATVTAPSGPVAPELTTTGPVGEDQTATFTLPPGGAITLLDADGDPTTTVARPGVGTFVLDPATGVVTFTPDPARIGPVPPVAVRITDAYGQSDEGTYTPSVTFAAPMADALTSTGVGPEPQTVTLAVPPGGSARLLDAEGEPVTSREVGGVGTWVLDTATGSVTFTPVLGYQGTPEPIGYVLVDRYGQRAEGTYGPTVTPPAPPTAPLRTSSSTPEDPSAPQTVTVPVPTGGTVRLLDPDGREATSVTVPGEGRYVLDPTTGTITFTPLDTFAGPVTPIPVRLTDAYGQSATGSYQPEIAARPVVAPPADPSGSAGPSESAGSVGSAAAQRLSETEGEPSGLLARTGSESGRLALVGLGVLLVGAVLSRSRLLARRTR